MFKSLLLKGRTLCLLLCCIVSSLVVTAQTKQTGKVIGSDDKLPVVGASVRIKGTNTGAVTDVNGDFTLSLTAGNVLVVSYIGYQTKDVTVTSGAFLTISLTPANSTLNEVVVTGYTSQRKKDIAGAISVVDVNDAKKLPAASSEQLLQGQAAGVSVTAAGIPGAPSVVYIRGISNFGNSQPLYVIDGVQTTNMADVNPNDIESIQVLKDAGAAAIYGVSGGNGVVIITTKRGKSGKSTLSYDAYYGTQVPKGGNVYDALNSTGQSELTWFADPTGNAIKIYPDGSGTVPVYGYQGPGGNAGVITPSQAAGFNLGQYHFDASNPGNDFLIQKFNQQGTDWYHAIMKSAPEQYHTLTASGANDKNTYFMSVGYLDQQATEQYMYLKRYEARVNTTFKITNAIRLGENGYVNYKESPLNVTGTNFTNNVSNGPLNQNEGDPISYAYRQLPQIPIYDIAGNWGGTYDGPGGEPLGNSSNPLAVLSQLQNSYYKTWNIQGNIFAEADIFKHVTAKTQIGGTINNNYSNAYTTNPYEDYEGHTTANSVSEGASFNSSYNWTNTLLYKQVFGKHNVSFLAGYEQKQYYGRYMYATGHNLFTTTQAYADLSNATDSPVANSQADQPTSTQSFFARLDYIYNDKYILGATVRRDGFSGFFPGQQWGTFPSVSLGWRISQEDFLKSVSWINDLKLRASWGEAGNNSNVPGANYASSYAGNPMNGYYPIGGGNALTQGFYSYALGNEKTTWETDKILNFGVDASLFNHIDLTAEYYRKSISGLLFQLPLAATVGAAAPPFVNIGNVQNNGFDFSATYHGASGDFRYSATANIGEYRNKIITLPSPGYYDSDPQRNGTLIREEVGHPIGSFFGYQTNGFYSAADMANPAVPKYTGAQVGSFKYVDQDHNGVIDLNDRTFIGNPNPDFNYGVNLNTSYKNWDFSMVLYGEQGNKDLHYTNYFTDFYSSFNGGKSNKALYESYGSPFLKGTPILPIQTDKTQLGTDEPSSYFVENGSFLKCRVMQLGYSFSPGVLKAIGITKLHIYAQATNLFTITKYTGIDPELLPGSTIANGKQDNNVLGVDVGNYPNNQRQYILGVNLSL